MILYLFSQPEKAVPGPPGAPGPEGPQGAPGEDGRDGRDVSMFYLTSNNFLCLLSK